MDAAVDRVRSNPLIEYLTADHMCCLSVSVLAQLIQMAELELFTLLHLWVEVNEVRVEIGLRLSQHICFAGTDPTILSSTINKSGLTTEEQLHEAQRSHKESDISAFDVLCSFMFDYIEVEGTGAEEGNGVY